MGRSITCTFSAHVQFEHSEVCYGAMSLKDALWALKSEIQYRQDNNKSVPTSVIVWAQTQRGRNLLRGYDFIEIFPDGRKAYRYIDSAIHQTTEQD